MNTRTDPDLLLPLSMAPLLPGRDSGSQPLGRILTDMNALEPGDLVKAIALAAREDARFGDILLANDMVSDEALCRALAMQFGCMVADLEKTPPDARLIDWFGPERCLRDGFVPWKRAGSATVLVTCRPEDFDWLAAALPPEFGQVRMAVATERQVQTALLRIRRRVLSQRAESRVSPVESCRDWRTASMARMTFGLVLCLGAGLVVSMRMTVLVLCLWAILALLANTILKAAAAIATLRHRRKAAPTFMSGRQHGRARRLPTVSLLVPLYREREIAGRLITRLSRLNYPKELLDICLVVEEDDDVTQRALSAIDLPRWMREVTVPRGVVQTKPRALNYALDFCRGSVVGVYDAEDAPEPDQIHKVVRRFHEAGPDLACIQGMLDFYNPRANWLSRCFTIEYATWFRTVLPGLERLGFVIPLGGTTVFFRRDALEELGGWDAHNVTEDADLGVRLARHGYRTELIETVTLEEANCRIWPWVRQRSRWIKGYAITWAVHMRDPRRLLRDLGPWRFLGVNLLFLGSLSQFILAPVLWTFWAVPLGLWHPLDDVLTPLQFNLLAGLFLTAEAITVAVGIHALASTRHRGLWAWVPTLHFYFPLAAIAAYKGIWELIVRPFYWDKTAHGLGEIQLPPLGPARRRLRRG